MRTAIVVSLALCIVAASNAAEITVHKRHRTPEPGAGWAVRQTEESWQPAETAIIVCDMWDSHHCLNAVRRVVEMAPRMNEVLNNARERGVLIIHAPSSCMEPYANHPGRKLAQSAPQAANLPSDIGQWCRHIPAEDKGVYPIDQTQGGEDDNLQEHQLWHEKLAALGRNPKAPWKSQVALLEIKDNDAISDSGVEIWNLLEARGIRNVILLGVHTNMCVLGRPFGLRQMAKNGKNVVLMRDMTDTMYDPTKAPYVNHFTGTHLIVEHIEKYVCPSITSASFLGGEPFRFSRDRRKIVMLIGDDEYKTEVSLPALVKSDLAPLGFDVTIIHSDSADKNNFPGMAEAVKSADLVLVSVRRRLPPKEQLDALRQHVTAGKPLVGIRTACHAWTLRDAKQNAAAAAKGQASWLEFDPEVFGGHYTGHHGNGPKTKISVADGAKEHPILLGVAGGGILPPDFVGNGSLYKVAPLAASTSPLLFGTVDGQPAEPIAWTNLAGGKRARAFFTSFGHEADFQNAAFRKLLVNGIFWALEDPYAVGQDIDELLPASVK